MPNTLGNETTVHTYFLVFLYWKRVGFFRCSRVTFCSYLETYLAAASIWCLSSRILLQRHLHLNPGQILWDVGYCKFGVASLPNFAGKFRAKCSKWTKCYSAWWQTKNIISGVTKKPRQVCRVLHAVASPGTLISVCRILPLGVKRPSMLCM